MKEDWNPIGPRWSISVKSNYLKCIFSNVFCFLFILIVIISFLQLRTLSSLTSYSASVDNKLFSEHQMRTTTTSTSLYGVAAVFASLCYLCLFFPSINATCDLVRNYFFLLSFRLILFKILFPHSKTIMQTKDWLWFISPTTRYHMSHPDA